MIKRSDSKHLDLRSFEAALSLEKLIVMGDFTAEQNTPGHCIDYLDTSRSYVTLHAQRDLSVTLWESQALLETCETNTIVKVYLKWSVGDLVSYTDLKQLEFWCARNDITLDKSKDEAKLTYYCNLFATHHITGELMVSPILYFANNPAVRLEADADVVFQLLNTKPIILEIKQNQIVCFDKYHYQWAYHPDLNFIRVHDAHRNY